MISVIANVNKKSESIDAHVKRVNGLMLALQDMKNELTQETAQAVYDSLAPGMESWEHLKRRL